MLKLQEIAGLRDITEEVLSRVGCYFLCKDDTVLYVGQSAKNAVGRSADHCGGGRFDQVFFLPWPRDNLNSLEGALIRAMQPPINGRTSTGKMWAPVTFPNTDAEILARITAQQRSHSNDP